MTVPCSVCGRPLKRRRYYCNTRCKGCVRAYKAAWNQKNKAHIQATYREWAKRNVLRQRERKRAWEQANIEKARKSNNASARRKRRRDWDLLLSLPCHDCGMCHTQERRQTILRRMMPCSSLEIHDAWGCIWGPSGKDHKGSAGAQMLRRDLKLIGALSSSHGEYYLPRRAA